MPIKKHFINRGLQQTMIEEFLASQLDNSGYAGVDLQKTPMGTKITIRTSRPGIVIGQKGKKIRDLTEEVKKRFNINVPTIDVEDVKEPDLNAQIQAEKIAYAIEKGQNYRRATYSVMRRVIKSGARGIEIHISGKTTSQRARTQVFRAGVISKCGTPAEDGVDRGIYHLVLKSGIMGIRVKIMSLAFKMPDEVIIREGIFEQPVTTPKLVGPISPFLIESTDEIEEEPDEVIPEEDADQLFDDTSAATEQRILETPDPAPESAKVEPQSPPNELTPEISGDDSEESSQKKKKSSRSKRTTKTKAESEEEEQ